jgi:hypothetical protein
MNVIERFGVTLWSEWKGLILGYEREKGKRKRGRTGRISLSRERGGCILIDEVCVGILEWI